MSATPLPPVRADELAAKRIHRAAVMPHAGLSAAQMEDRATIQRGAAARPEVAAFRELRTRLLSMMDSNFVTLVAPVSVDCGGSFVARNLAAAVAFDQAHRALLVDCDLRHPTQHETMRVDPVRGGLMDYIDRHDAEVADVLYDTGVSGLHLLPAGQPREAGTEYFSSARMRLLLETVRIGQPNCYIFLDSPPVRTGPEARILADLADVVVLVAGYGRDTPATIAQAAANFDPAKFAGVVFNEGV